MWRSAPTAPESPPAASTRPCGCGTPLQGSQLGDPLTGHVAGVVSVAFSPDGTRIVSGSLDQTLRIWHVAAAQQVGDPLKGHMAAAVSVAYSPDGTRIVSGGWDSTVRLWDATTGQPVGKPLIGHTDWVSSVAFSPDGTRVVSGGWDKTLRLWPVYRDAVSALCAKLAANMSRQQWRDWVSTDIAYIEQCPRLPIPTD